MGNYKAQYIRRCIVAGIVTGIGLPFGVINPITATGVLLYILAVREHKRDVQMYKNIHQIMANNPDFVKRIMGK